MCLGVEGLVLLHAAIQHCELWQVIDAKSFISTFAILNPSTSIRDQGRNSPDNIKEISSRNAGLEIKKFSIAICE